MEAKFRQVIRAFFPAVALLLIQNILAFGAAMMLAIMDVANSDAMITGEISEELGNQIIDQISSADFNMAISVLYGLVCSVLFFFWYRKVRKGEVHESFVGYRIWMIPGLVLLAVALQFLTGYITEVASLVAPNWLAEYELLLDQVGLSEDSYSVLTILYTVLLAPVVEELAFRGLTYTYLRRGVSMWSAILVQALMFAGFHGNFFQASYTVVFGFVMGYIYAKSENIYLTIALHIGYNFIAMFASQWIYLGESAVSFYCILLTTMIACYVGIQMVTYSLPQLVKPKKS